MNDTTADGGFLAARDGAEAQSFGKLLNWGNRKLSAISDTPRLDAEILLANACGVTRSKVIAFPEIEIDAQQLAVFRDSIARRAMREPVAYIVGERDFYSISLKVSPAVLVPRPETELIVDALLSMCEPSDDLAVLDLGTGSGALALTIKYERPNARVVALDASAEALAVARENGRRLGLDVEWLQSNWLSNLEAGKFDLIVCNPPYLRTAHARDPDLSFEPTAALDGGMDGLDAIRSVLEQANSYLADNGVLIMEHGFDQRDDVLELAKARAYSVLGSEPDAAGHDRIVILGRAS